MFKQIQLFELGDTFSFSVDRLQQSLEGFLFSPCLPSLPMGYGWTGLWDLPDAPIVKLISNGILFCAQIEEKILPSSVVRKAVSEKAAEIEMAENRKVGRSEKSSLKEEMIMTLLPRAFTKITRVYAYIDIKQRLLILGTTNLKKTEQFLSLFKKSISNDISALDIKKLSPILTKWLQEKNYPSSLNIEKECVLQDPRQVNRVIRCKHQDLFSSSIQTLIKEGCEVKQLGLSWEDQISFILRDDFSLQSIRPMEKVLEQEKSMEAETLAQKVYADFIIIEAVFSELLKRLLSLFKDTNKKEKSIREAVLV